ncbi:MAG: hypothetical protein AVDCRST_MAG61-1775, partial [uncultured Friedmanniella sp.]
RATRVRARNPAGRTSGTLGTDHGATPQSGRAARRHLVPTRFPL